MKNPDRTNHKIYEEIYREGNEILRYPDEAFLSYYHRSLKGNPEISNNLNIGFGAGRHVVFLAQEGLDVYGIESSLTAVQSAQKWLLEENLSACLMKGVSYEIPLPTNYFDSLLCWGVINSVIAQENLNQTMDEFTRVLRPSGKLIISFTSHEDMKFSNAQNLKENIYEINYNNKKYTYRLWDKEESEYLLTKHEFSIEKMGYCYRNINFDPDLPNAYWTVSANNKK